MKVAVIGSGFGARVVAPVFAATEGCEVVDVVSARDDAAIAALVARPDVDLVSVHSPPFLHAPHVRAALAAGKAVLCDKPFAVDAAVAGEARGVALCNFEFRYAPARVRLRELVRAGALGAIEHVQIMHCSAGSRVPLRPWGWLFDRDLGGGWIGAWASHAVDQLRFLFDADIEVVHSQPRTDVRERPDAAGVMRACTAEDGLTATLRLSTGATVAIDSTFAAAANLTPRFTVFGSEAVADVIADERIVVQRGSDRETIEIGDRAGDRHLEPMRRFAVVVRDAVTSGDIPRGAPTFADGLACDRVLDRLRVPQSHQI